MSRPDGLPEDPQARGDQIHANANLHLTELVEETALSLRTPFPAPYVAENMAGRAIRSNPAVIATMFAAAVVRLAEQHNDDNQLAKIELPSIDWPVDGPGLRSRAHRYLLGLHALMIEHGLVLQSPLDVTLYDPVRGLTVAHTVQWNETLTRYTCQAPPPYEWTIP